MKEIAGISIEPIFGIWLADESLDILRPISIGLNDWLGYEWLLVRLWCLCLWVWLDWLKILSSRRLSISRPRSHKRWAWYWRPDKRLSGLRRRKSRTKGIGVRIKMNATRMLCIFTTNNMTAWKGITVDGGDRRRCLRRRRVSHLIGGGEYWIEWCKSQWWWDFGQYCRFVLFVRLYI